MTVADQGQIGSPHPLLCARGTLGLWSWECGQLGLWGSGKLGARPRSALESKPRSVWTSRPGFSHWSGTKGLQRKPCLFKPVLLISFRKRTPSTDPLLA